MRWWWLLLLLLLTACEDQSSFYMLEHSGSSGSGGTQEYENLYIAGDTGTVSVLNISGTANEVYEVHIE